MTEGVKQPGTARYESCGQPVKLSEDHTVTQNRLPARHVRVAAG